MKRDEDHEATFIFVNEEAEGETFSFKTNKNFVIQYNLPGGVAARPNWIDRSLSINICGGGGPQGDSRDGHLPFSLSEFLKLFRHSNCMIDNSSITFTRNGVIARLNV